MSSELRAALPLVVICAVAGAIGCGHKAAPYPPPAKNPARTADLTVQQRGQTAILSFTYPQTTVAGELLETLESIEIWRVRSPVAPPLELEEDPLLEEDGDAIEPPDEDAAAADEPDADELDELNDDEFDEMASEDELDGKAEEEGESDEEGEDGEESGSDEEELPEISLEEQTAVSALEFNATAELIETLTAEAIEAAVSGDRLVVSVDLGAAAHEEWSHTFAIRSLASEQLASTYSNLVTLVQRQPPPGPTDFAVEGQSDGVRLSWSLVESEEYPAEKFMVYRRSSDSRLYGEPVARLGSEIFEYLDRSAVFGERYIYGVTSVGQENPLIESFFGGEREIDHADRFAPEPPTNLIALAEAGRVRLLWDASADDDVVGYIIFRRQADDEFRRLNQEPVTGVEYNDRTVSDGAAYDYRISAVDDVGNQGEQSEGVVARVP
ncbi:MAG: fibronectin type III domain-containing protein [Thermoanaerobaculia bacterium]